MTNAELHESISYELADLERVQGEIQGEIRTLDKKTGEFIVEVRGMKALADAEHRELYRRVGKVEVVQEKQADKGSSRLWAVVLCFISAAAGAGGALIVAGVK